MQRHHLAKDARKVLAEVLQQHAGEECRRVRNTQTLGEDGARPAVRRVRGEVVGLAAKALAHRKRFLGGAAHLDRKIAEAQLQIRRHGVAQVVDDARARVHQVDLGEHSDSARAVGIMLPTEFDGGIGLQIASRGAHHQDDRALRRDVRAHHVADLLLDVLRLPLRRQAAVIVRPGRSTSERLGTWG